MDIAHFVFCKNLGLAAFEHEGIQNITALKDQLVAANHDQTPAIKKRHEDVIQRLIIAIKKMDCAFILLLIIYF